MKKYIGSALILFVVFSLTFNPSAARAVVGTTYYVDNTNPACDNSGPGTLAQPLCSLTVASDNAFAGDTVRVLAGTYAETIKPNSGDASNPVTLSAAPGVTVTGNGSALSGGGFRLLTKAYIVIDGFTIANTDDYGIYVFGSNHITITNNIVTNSGSPANTREGIYLDGTTDSTVSGNVSHHNSLDGIRLVNTSTNNLVSHNVSYANSSEGPIRLAEGINIITNSTGNTIIHNTTFANEDSGINLNANPLGSNLVIGNVSYGNGDHGIDNNASPGNVIVGNTIYGNVTAGINIENSSGSATVMNNVAMDNGWNYVVGNPDPDMAGGQPGNIRVDSTSTSGTTLDYNLYYLKGLHTQIVWGVTLYSNLPNFKNLNPGQEASGLAGNPLFRSIPPIARRPASAPYNITVNVGDFHLQAASPAIDSANSNASNEPLLDLDGRPRVDISSVPNTGTGIRTFDDRGAYEYGFQIYLPMIIR